MATKRRPRGEGTLRRRPDGRWEVRLYVGRRRLQATAGTQEAALTELDRMKRQAALGIPAKRYTVSDALDDFMQHGQAVRGWAPATVRSYATPVDVHLRPALGKRLLVDLSVREVSRLCEKMLSSGTSARHVAHVRAVLRACIAHAMRQELVHRNVAALSSPPAVRRKEMRALTREETARLFAALEGDRSRPLVVVSAVLGLRLGELIALRWEDVDLDSATLTVRRTGARISGRYIEGPPKSAKSRRTVVLPLAVVSLLRAQRAAIAAERLRLADLWRDEDRVFPGEGGGPCGATTIRKALDRAQTRANLPRVRIHDLRHTAASGLLAAGGSLRDVQEMLGHSSYSLTADLYTHLADDQRRATALRLEEALGLAISGA